MLELGGGAGVSELFTVLWLNFQRGGVLAI